MTPLDAVDAMHEIFMAVWKPLGFPVVWNDLVADVPEKQTLWARVTVQHTDGRQASLSNQDGVRIWRNSGIYSIQLFEPVENGRKRSYEVGKAILDAFRKSHPDCVWFTNPKLREAGRDGAFLQTNLSINFEYKEVV